MSTKTQQGPPRRATRTAKGETPPTTSHSQRRTDGSTLPTRNLRTGVTVTVSDDATTAPYAESARTYRERGWRGVIPVDLGKTGVVPPGFTGRNGSAPDDEQVHAWTNTHGARNVGLRLPEDVVGIDVDCYDGKQGCDTLAWWELNAGLLPATWSSTARDDGSRILFYRVPPDRRWLAELPEGGVEIIQRGHRWARVWPSLNPKTGLPYRWLTPTNTESDRPPRPGDLAELPERWVDALGRKSRVTAADTHGDPFDWDHALRGDAPSGHQQSTLFKAACSLKARNATNSLAVPLLRAVVRGFTNFRPEDPWDLDAADRMWQRIRDDESIPWGASEVSEDLAAWARGDSVAGNTLAVHRVADLHAEHWKPEWLVKRLWPYPGHGMLGGMEKTFKTWLLSFIAVAVASGENAFDDERFEVVTPGAVVFFTGESGRFALERRLRRIATKLHGMSDEEYDSLPIFVVDQRATLTSERFLATLHAVIADVDPVLVIVDPLYTYVGGHTEAGNVFAVGEALHAVSDVCNAARVALAVGHHLRKTAGGQVPTLTDLTQAGSREWVKAWLLVHHRERPDANAGCGRLQVQTGGSEGYGGVYEVDVCVGAFNVDTFDHDDAFWVDVRDGEVIDAGEQREMAKNLRDESDLIALLRVVAEAGDFSNDTGKRALRRSLGWGSDRRTTVVADTAVERGLLTTQKGTQNRVLHGLTARGRAHLWPRVSQP